MEGVQSNTYDDLIKDYEEKRMKELDDFVNNGWLPWEEDKDFKLVYKDDHKSGLRSIKSEICINSDIKSVFDFIEKIENKSKYDANFDSGYEFVKINDVYSIFYLKFKGKFLIAPRDFVNFSYIKYDDQNSIIMHTSTKHEKLPEIKGNVRAELIFGGYLIDRVEDNLTKVTFVSCADLKLNQTLVNTTLKDVAYCVKNIKKILNTEK